MINQPPTPLAGHCDLCGEPVPRSNPDAPADAHDLLDHLRLMHPDQYGDGPLHWPDGQQVVIDETEFDAPADDGLVTFGRIIGMNVVSNAEGYRTMRAYFERDVRHKIARFIAAAGITPPAHEDMPVRWFRMPNRADFDAGEPYREESVTDAMVIGDDDTLMVRVEGLLERAEDGRTVLTPTDR